MINMKEQILRVYAHNECRAGHQLMINHFIAYLGNEFRGEIKNAIDELLDDELLELREDKNSAMLFLTEKGETEMLRLV